MLGPHRREMEVADPLAIAKRKAALLRTETELNEHLTQGKVTDRTLSLQLKELEQSKLLTRKVYPEIPPAPNTN